eukprot:2908245-Alexandrium_andersonii.AAC.1
MRIVLPDAAMHRRVLNALQYDKRKVGSKGRAVDRDIAEVGLQKGDRLEPCSRLPDVGLYEQIDAFPCE